MQEYYLYVYLDPRKSGHYTYQNLISFIYEPIYIGKGKQGRYFSHIKEATTWSKPSTNNGIKNNKIKKIIDSGSIPYINILDTGTESDILALETFYIKTIGRLIDSSGPLTNIKIDNSPSNYIKHPRKGNGLEGKEFQTIIDPISNEMFQINKNDTATYISNGFILLNEWQRPLANNSMSRKGKKNPMYGQSAVKGRKWITLSTGESRLLTKDEINELSEKFTFGRNVCKNSRKRVIIKNNLRSTYMSDEDIINLPEGTEYQYGLHWKNQRETHTVRRKY